MNFYEIFIFGIFFTTHTHTHTHKIGHISDCGENQIKIVHEDQHLEFFTTICLINYGRLCFLWVLSGGRRNRCKSKPKNSSTIDWKSPCSWFVSWHLHNDQLWWTVNLLLRWDILQYLLCGTLKGTLKICLQCYRFSIWGHKQSEYARSVTKCRRLPTCVY
jgi:hypothetical protein